MTEHFAPEGTTDAENLAPLARSRRLLLVAYDGYQFKGFQQQENVETIAGHLDDAIRTIDPGATRTLGSSRTDAGVHARLQPVTFDTTRSIPSRGWVLALSERLPPTISVFRSSEVDTTFDPRKKPLWKVYRYRVLQSPVDDPFLYHRAFRVRDSLDVARMREAALPLVGEHDFAAFRSSKDPRTTTVRHLHRVDVEVRADDPRSIDIVVQGDRFLYNMVRIIAGTLVDVGRGKIPGDATRVALSSKSRFDLGMTAPAHGLCLEHVELPDWGRDPWPTGPGPSLGVPVP
jgi:tRNA pseudouridine38-40 synthase